MTKDQIKEITMDYAQSVCADDRYDNIQERESEERMEYDFALPVIEWLNDHFCIVEKTKVKEMYKGFKVPNYPCVDPKPTVVARILLTDLFGTSMFNQNEE